VFFAKIRKIVLDTLFPIECLGCGKEDVWLCDECFQNLPLKQGYLEPIDFSPSYLDGFFVASDWENKVLQEAIRKLKYNFVQELSVPLSNLLIKKTKKIFEIYKDVNSFTIIPVPLHKRRLSWRGFNQAELLAKQVAERFKMELDNNLIKRVKNTSPQVKLKGKARAKNIAGAFDVNPSRVGLETGTGSLRASSRFMPGASLFGLKNTIFTGIIGDPRVHAGKPVPDINGKSFLLIDDIITTGATVNEVAKVLKNYGAKEVWALAIARG